MTSPWAWKRLLLPLSVAAGLGTLVSASSHSGLRRAPDCAAGPRFCFDPPVNAGPLMNTPQFDGGPSISADGLTLYFTSGRPGALGQAEGHYDEDLYLSTRRTVGDPFGAPVHCLHRSTARSSTLRPKSLRRPLALFRQRSAVRPVRHLCIRETDDGPSLGIPTPTRLQRQHALRRGHPEHLGRQPYTLLVEQPARRPGRFDIWYATRPGPTGEFGPAINLSELNTPFDDFAPEIAPNDKVLYFSSSRPGGGTGSVNLWVSRREHKGDPFGEAMPLDDINGPIFQAKASISGFSEIFWMAVRPGGFGDIDIYYATRPE